MTATNEGSARQHHYHPNEPVRHERGVVIEYDNLVLRTALQPIFSIAHRKAVGYEALLRAEDATGRPVSPMQVLQRPTSSAGHLELDRYCRWLHAHNFSKQPDNDAWLFLNLDSQSLVKERPDAGFMRAVFSETGLTSRRIVIEILESEIEDGEYLRELIHHFRNLGCLIAIDDFGSGHSNFDRIWELQPDIVKIDRRLVQRAGVSSKVERMLAGIVDLIHESGSLVVIEGVETEKEALVAISCNADMVQGYYFARPARSTITDNHFSNQMNALLRQQQSARGQCQSRLHHQFGQFRHNYELAINALSEGQSLEHCGEHIFAEPHAVRCYLLDEWGYQIGNSLYSPGYTAKIDIRFAPLLAGDNANWSHRHYHYKAMQDPGNIQISRPYLSVAGSHMCITVSQAVRINGCPFVFCCDLDWKDENQALHLVDNAVNESRPGSVVT